MAQLVLGTVGAVVGGMVGGPVGARIGWAIGAFIGGMLDKPDKPKQSLMDLRIIGTEYGQPIPYVIAAALLPGQMWWNSDRIPITIEGEGGKGGGPSAPDTVIYKMNALYGFTCNQGYGVRKIFENGKLIWTNGKDAAAGSVEASEDSETWDRMTFYSGASDQLPDPTYEAAVGAGNAPAYRGRVTIFIEGLNLGQSGALRNLTFEIVIDGESGGIPDSRVLEMGPSAYSDMYSGGPISIYDNETGYAWVVEPDFIEPILEVWVTDDRGTHDLLYHIEQPRTSGDGSAGGLCIVDSTREVWVIDNGFPNHTFAYIYDADTVAFLEKVYLGTTSSIHAVVYNPTLFEVFMISYGCFIKIIDPISRSVKTITSLGDITGLDYNYTWVSGLILTTDYLAIFSYGSSERITLLHRGDYSLYLVVNDPYPGLPYHGFSYDSVREKLILYDDYGQIAEDYGGFNLVDLATGEITVRFISLPATVQDTDPYPSTHTMAVCYHSYTDRYIFGCSASETPPGYDVPWGTTLWIVNPDTFETEQGATYQPYNPSEVWQMMPPMLDVPGQPYVINIDLNSIKRMYISSTAISVKCVTVEEATRRLCERTGMVEGTHFDVSALSTITREVCSLAVAQVTGMRSPIEVLMDMYFFGATVNDKIYFIPRGGSPELTIPYDDLGAVLEGSNEGEQEPFELKIASDLELAAFTFLSYINIDFDYQVDMQYSDRLVTAVPGTVNDFQVAIGLTPSHAKAIADTISLDSEVTRRGTTIAVLLDHPQLTPTDVINVVDREGNTWRMRIVRSTDSYPISEFELVMDDPSVLASQGITDVNYENSTEVLPPAETIYELLDVPIARDVDDDAGFYVAAKGSNKTWAGAGIYSSLDDVSYSQKAVIEERAVMGRTTTALGDYTHTRMFDETNSVVVDVGDATLTSSTREAVLNDPSINAWIIGNEGIQAVDATFVMPGVYRLSRLLRGGRGTEWAMVGHSTNERAVKVGSAGVRRIQMNNSELGLSRYYRGVTLGRMMSTGTQKIFTNMAIGLKPFSPIDLRAVRDSSENITFSVQPRTRLSVRMIGALGINVPFGLGETTEAYQMDVYSNTSFSTVVRTISVSDIDEISYSAANQTADGLTPGNPVSVRVYKISSVVGRGYALQGTA